MTNLMLTTYDWAAENPMVTLASAMVGASLLTWFVVLKPWHNEYADLVGTPGKLTHVDALRDAGLARDLRQPHGAIRELPTHMKLHLPAEVVVACVGSILIERGEDEQDAIRLAEAIVRGERGEGRTIGYQALMREVSCVLLTLQAHNMLKRGKVDA